MQIAGDSAFVDSSPFFLLQGSVSGRGGESQCRSRNEDGEQDKRLKLQDSAERPQPHIKGHLALAKRNQKVWHHCPPVVCAQSDGDAYEDHLAGQEPAIRCRKEGAR